MQKYLKKICEKYIDKYFGNDISYTITAHYKYLTSEVVRVLYWNEENVKYPHPNKYSEMFNNVKRNYVYEYLFLIQNKIVKEKYSDKETTDPLEQTYDILITNLKIQELKDTKKALIETTTYSKKLESSIEWYKKKCERVVSEDKFVSVQQAYNKLSRQHILTNDYDDLLKKYNLLLKKTNNE